MEKKLPIIMILILMITNFLCLSGCNQHNKNAINGKIVFISDQGGVYNFFMINSDGSGLQDLTNQVASNTISSLIGNADPSPDGKHIVYEANRDGNNEIYIINIENKAQVNLTKNKANDYSPAWSPDGKRIAFISDRDAVLLNSERDIRTNNIYIMDADGNNTYRLTNNNINAGYSGLAWSPDGTKLLFSLISVSPYGGVFSSGVNIMNLHDLKTTQIDPDFNSRVSCPKWSPDGKQIICSRLGNNFENIFTMKDDGTAQIVLTSSSFSMDTDPYWSPDSKFIVFSSNRGNGYHIYIMNNDGTNQILLTNGSGEETNPIWLPKP